MCYRIATYEGFEILIAVKFSQHITCMVIFEKKITETKRQILICHFYGKSHYSNDLKQYIYKYLLKRINLCIEFLNSGRFLN